VVQCNKGQMACYARLPLLLTIQYSLIKASPLRRARASPSSVVQDLSKTVVTKTVVTTITTQETKTVVTKEKPAEDPEPARLDNDNNGRQSILPLSEGSTSMAEVYDQLRRAAPREEVETIRFPSSPSAYFRKDGHGSSASGDTGMLEDNVSDQSQPEQAPHSPELRFLDLQEKHDVSEEVKEPEERHHEPQHSAKTKSETSTESKQDVIEKVDHKVSGDSWTNRWQSFLSVSEGSDLGFQMLPAACRLLFFLVGVVVVFLIACGFASVAVFG